MDASVLNLVNAVVLAAIGSATSIAVAFAQTRKTKAEAHQETSEAKAALREEINELRGLLADCKKQHAESRAEADRQREELKELRTLADMLGRKLDNLRAGYPSTYSPLGVPETRP